jgi:tripartite-type tricarboxylate transporter receptor subunit TctC
MQPTEEATMKTLRRIACGITAALLCAAANAQTGDYPNRPLKLITPFTAGGAIDTLCRVIGERLA